MNVLVIAPHPDDEVLGCGGTMARLSDEGHNVYVCVVTRGTEPLFSDDAVKRTRNEQRHAHSVLGVKGTTYLDFPAAMLEESHRYELNSALASVVTEIGAEIVFVPHFGDMQLDHRLVSDAAMVAVRPRGDYCTKYVLAYETLSETEWNIPHPSLAFIPNCYIDITSTINRKLEALASFKSQMAEFPAARSVKSAESLAYLRGSTVSVFAAEAFYIIRAVI